MKWWLISDEDVEEIREALGAPTHRANDYNCEDWPPGKRCRGCEGDEMRKKALHTLDGCKIFYYTCHVKGEGD